MSQNNRDDEGRRVPYSQRHGLRPTPPQLQLGEISLELRRLLWAAVFKDFKQSIRHTYESAYIDGYWTEMLEDFHVQILKEMPDDFSRSSHGHQNELRRIFEEAPLEKVFDVVEFFLDHPAAQQAMLTGLARAFVDARAAYRILDGNTITPVGTAEEAATIERAIENAGAASATGARTHLLKAGAELRAGRWSDSVRESIHAVESVASLLAPESNSLSGALAKLESAGHMHGSLKSAFLKLYGYSSDEKGVRHALVFEEVADVDEADALFMLGVCASFASYALSRSGQI